MILGQFFNSQLAIKHKSVAQKRWAMALHNNVYILYNRQVASPNLKAGSHSWRLRTHPTLLLHGQDRYVTILYFHVLSWPNLSFHSFLWHSLAEFPGHYFPCLASGPLTSPSISFSGLPYTSIRFPGLPFHWMAFPSLYFNLWSLPRHSLFNHCPGLISYPCLYFPDMLQAYIPSLTFSSLSYP